MHRVKNCMLPLDFCNLFVKLYDSRVHTRRSPVVSMINFYLNFVRLDVCKRFISFVCVLLSLITFNLLPHCFYSKV